MSAKKILKVNETTYFGAGTSFGVNENVTFRSSKPHLVSVTNSGQVTVIAQPSKLEHVAITAEDQYGIPLGSQVIYVVPNSFNKDTVTKTASYTITEKFLKLNEVSQFIVDAGQGPHVGVTYGTSTTDLITIDSSGQITCVKALNVPKQVMVYGRDEFGFILNSAAVVVLPSGADKTKLNVIPTITVNIDAGA